MRFIAPIVASVAVAVLMLVGFYLLDRQGTGFGASEGAALAVAAVAAFLLTYDLLARTPGEGGEHALRARAAGTRVTPKIAPDEINVVKAAQSNKNEIDFINEQIPQGEQNIPAILKVVVRQESKYELSHLTYQVNQLQVRRPQHPYVYFVTPRDHFICFASAKDLLEALKKVDSGRSLIIELINHGRDDPLPSMDGLSNAQVSNRLTNAEALTELARAGQREAMIVNDRSHRPVGIIDWATLSLRVLDEPSQAGRPRGSRRRPPALSLDDGKPIAD